MDKRLDYFVFKYSLGQSEIDFIPSFDPNNIIKKDTSRKTNKKIDIFPKYIKDVLETLKY